MGEVAEHDAPAGEELLGDGFGEVFGGELLGLGDEGPAAGGSVGLAIGSWRRVAGGAEWSGGFGRGGRGLWCRGLGGGSRGGTA